MLPHNDFRVMKKKSRSQHSDQARELAALTTISFTGRYKLLVSFAPLVVT
jgi:hypothetical protein